MQRICTTMLILALLVGCASNALPATSVSSTPPEPRPTDIPATPTHIQPTSSPDLAISKTSIINTIMANANSTATAFAKAMDRIRTDATQTGIAQSALLEQYAATPSISPLAILPLTDCSRYPAGAACPQPAPRLPARLAFFDRNCILSVIDLATGTGWSSRLPIATQPLFDSTCSAQWSADGTYLKAWGKDAAYSSFVYRFNGTRLWYGSDPPPPVVFPVAPSFDQLRARDGRKAWTEVVSDTTVLHVQRPDGQLRTYTIVDHQTDRGYGVRGWLADDSSLLLSGSTASNSAWVLGGYLLLVNLKTGAVTDLDMMSIERIAIHPVHNNLVAIVESRQGDYGSSGPPCTLMLLNARSLNKQCLINNQPAPEYPPSMLPLVSSGLLIRTAYWSPDGSALAFVYGNAIAISPYDHPLPVRVIAQYPATEVAVLGWITNRYLLIAFYHRVVSEMVSPRALESIDLRLISVDGQTDQLLATGIAAPTFCYPDCDWNSLAAVFTKR